MSRVLFLPFLCVAFTSSPTAQQPQRAAQEAPGAGALSIQQLPLRRAGTGVDVPVRLDGSDVTLVLQPFSMRSERFAVLVDDGRALREVAPPPPATFRGTIAGRDGTVCASIEDDRITALVHTGGATWGIEPDERGHVVYRSDAVPHCALGCGCGNGHDAGAPVPGGFAVASPFVYEAELAIDADFAFFVRNGSSVAATVQAIERVMNPVDEVYRRDVQIRYRLTAVIVRTQPLYTSTGIGGLLVEFGAHWNQHHAATPRDVAHLFTGILDPNLYGMANLPSVCSLGSAYAVSAAYQPLHVDNVVLVAHELGHTWDAQHCLSFPCYIMCPLLGCASEVRFGAIEAPQIVAYRDAQACLEVIPAGAFVTYGSGCAGTVGVPAIGSAGSPVLGQQFGVTLSGARPNAAAALAIGWSDETWGALTLPWSLAPLGAPGCSVLVSGDVLLGMATNAAGAASWLLAVPPVPELFGITLFVQWVVVDPGANALGLVLSGAGAATLGDQEVPLSCGRRRLRAGPGATGAATAPARGV